MNLNFDHYCIISGVSRIANHVNRCKLCVPIQGVVLHGSIRLLKSSLIFVGHESTTYMVRVFSIALIQHCERDYCSKGPLQDIIVFSLHQANKKASASSTSTINSCGENTYAELVTITTRVNRRTFQGIYPSIDSVSEEYRKILYWPNNKVTIKDSAWV